ncbi:D-alpha,beta-D-heptose 1,7-bisphosphate phosphatase [Modicisalibacter ilicicola DSM 19980]|uniref:D,D-heptose 1,7-bisphosphate phosphatase n=1 Tax=Modicisalibacter ilicicola DSM 19980 TaxID=1121942 RepID=A0A1M4VSR4_9GAMM|nr:D-glycero-beta-D-manno-heptose 1,7-bisphosphate 7-phosphatase [Halomonas ilicicola]SHE71905.1 D-alpha,beta-D-heptose 1,7-bisphosphate phosphatase [Halomonas ilicicola DSM 19980]
MAICAEKLIILDRDGVINEDSDDYIKSLEEWRPYPQAIDAIARLAQAGWNIAVATNQSGIARGYYDEATLARIHAAMLERIEAAGGRVAHIAYCPHGPDEGCDCRKPAAGLLEQIRQALDMPTLEGAWLVGDTLRDLQAGLKMGCRPVLVRTGKGCRIEAQRMPEGTQVYDDLAGFVDHLLGV